MSSFAHSVKVRFGPNSLQTFEGHKFAIKTTQDFGGGTK